jgi:hypothetical protein
MRDSSTITGDGEGSGLFTDDISGMQQDGFADASVKPTIVTADSTSSASKNGALLMRDR